MTFRSYQEQAAKTAIYPNRGLNLSYPTLGLCGESGEVANKVKKVQRDHGGQITLDMKLALAKELGDVLWYVSATCDELGLNLEDVAEQNIKKLAARSNQNAITGSGDNR